MTITLNGTTGITTPAGTIQGDLTTTGNTVLGDASTDTLNVANGGLVKDSSGNFGLGVTPSAGNTTTNFQVKNIQLSALGQNLYLSSNANYNSGWQYIATDYATQYRQTSGQHQWLIAPSGSAGASISSFTQAMTLDNSGNLLVGTTTNNSRNSRLALNGNSVTWSVGPSSSNSTFVVYNPSEAGVYLPSGNTAWVSTSDERLKNITGEITDAISKVSQLRAAEFTWKSDESNKPQVGLIAQDVKAVLPEAISENDKEFLGVSYTEVIPLLVAAIKEQQAIITDLKARIETLENK